MRFPSIPPHTPVTDREVHLGPALHLGILGHKSPLERRQLRLHLAGAGETAPALSLLAGCAKACLCAASGGTSRETGTGKACSPQGEPQGPRGGQLV